VSSPAAAVVLAESDTGKGSPIGLFVVLLLIIAVYLLYRSMTGHIRRLPENFPGYGAAGTDEAAGPAGVQAAGPDGAADPDDGAAPNDIAGPDDGAAPNDGAGPNDGAASGDPTRRDGERTGPA
jgi:hypothetical protein